jgi:ABC-type Fe3+ transport system substrate-binding protein
VKRFWIVNFGFWIRGYQYSDACSGNYSGFRSDHAESKGGAADRNPKWVILALLLLAANLAYSAESPKWQQEWDQTLAAAKKEGEISFYGSEGYEKIFEVFQKRYPEIKVKSNTSRRGSEHGQAVMNERRAGQYLVDLFINGVVTPNTVFHKANILEPIRPQLILPEVVDESKWWSGKHHYADPDGNFIFVFQGNVHGSENAYNTKLVNPKDIKSYWDFLDPKWKGKIVAYDPSRVSTVAHSLRFLFNHPDLGAEYVRRLFSEMDVTYSRDERQMIDWLGAGKYAIAFFVTEVEAAAKQGLPIRDFEPSQFREGAFVGPSQGGVNLFKNPPNPNAAKIAINWLLSREGQESYQKVFASVGDVRQSMREDIAMEVIPPSQRRLKSVRYIYAGRPEWLDMAPVSKVIKEARAAGKK